jgi:hypothetical protein
VDRPSEQKGRDAAAKQLLSERRSRSWTVGTVGRYSYMPESPLRNSARPRHSAARTAPPAAWSSAGRAGTPRRARDWVPAAAAEVGRWPQGTSQDPSAAGSLTGGWRPATSTKRCSFNTDQSSRSNDTPCLTHVQPASQWDACRSCRAPPPCPACSTT